MTMTKVERDKKISETISNLGQTLLTISEAEACIEEIAEEYAKQKCKQHGIKLLKCVPHTWLDPLMTGDEKVIKTPYDEQDIERLLVAIRKRMLSKSLEEK